MGRVFDTGDVHGYNGLDKLEKFASLPLDFTMDDVVIINGDAGFIWFKKDTAGANIGLHKILKSFPFTILVVLGNHENYDKIAELPVKVKFGGLVGHYHLSPNVYYAQRGEVYTINNKTYWCFGGADSIDKFRRTKHLSWWEQEVPTQAEMDFGLHTLELYNNKVDFIITHDCPEKFFRNIPKYVLLGDLNLTVEPINLYFNKVEEQVDYGMWYCGHYHFESIDIDPDYDKIRFMYNSIVMLDDGEDK